MTPETALHLLRQRVLDADASAMAGHDKLALALLSRLAREVAEDISKQKTPPGQGGA